MGAIVLTDEQVVGVSQLCCNKRFSLFDEPGFGKTVQAIRACDIMGLWKVAVVCPANIVPQWKREFKDKALGEHDVHVFSYEKTQKQAVNQQWDAIIIDEGHYLKNRGAKRTQHILGEKCDGIDAFISNAEYAWNLTGSPAPNNASELWTQLRAFAPESILMKNGRIMDYWSFTKRFCIVKDNGFGMVINGSRNEVLLRERMAPHMLRRKRKGRPVIVTTLVLEPENARKFLKDIALHPEAPIIEKALKATTKEQLAKIAPQVATLRRFIGMAKVSPVAAQIKQEIEGGLLKLVVIAYHRDVIMELQRLLAADGIRCGVLIGGMTEKQSETVKKDFIKNNDCKVLIGQMTKTGTGTDGLQSVCKDMMIMESSWVPEENKQVIARLDRNGQSRNVLVRFVSLAGSLDEAISASVSRKTKDIITILG